MVRCHRIALNPVLLQLFSACLVTAYPERKVWIDQSCGDKVKDIWSIVMSMRDSGALATFETSGYRKTYYDYVFKGQYQSHIDETFEALADDLANSPVSANTRIYCDQESRWSRATSAEVPGNDKRPLDQQAWYDAENKIIFDVKDPQNNVPGCHASLKNSVLAQTYCNAKDGSDTCTITLCAKSLPDGQFQYYSLGQLKDARIDFSGSGPQRIDKFALLDTTILHELAHTIDHPNTLAGKWIDDPNGAYRWRYIRPMNALSAMANADSLAYLGLGSYIQDSMGSYQINDDGSIDNR